jgi:hypothetical protein
MFAVWGRLAEWFDDENPWSIVLVSLVTLVLIIFFVAIFKMVLR